MNRREVMQSLGALAAAEWSDAGVDVDEFDGWNDRGHRWTIQAKKFSSTSSGPVAHFGLEDRDVTDRLIEIDSGSRGVDLVIEGSDDEVRAGALAKLSPDDARELAVAIYMAADEVEARGYEP